jgi:hypothetical protein
MVTGGRRVTTGALAVAVLALLAAGCGSSGGRSAATAEASTPSAPMPCKLNAAQRRTVAKARADLRRLRRIQAPVQTYSQHGAPTQEEMTGKFEMDLGSTHLPRDVFANLLHRGKTAVSLCGACSQALEADEPFFGNRGQGRCG